MSFFKQICFLFLAPILSVNFILMANAEHSWSQKSLNEMTIDEKIGQLFMLAGYVDSEFAKSEVNNPQIIQEMDDLIKEYHIGGIAFVGPSESTQQVSLTNHYQSLSKYPLLIAQDLEWGLSMRLKDGMRFPKNITLGSVDDLDLIYKMGKEIGLQAKLIGVHMNLSPVLDVNIEPENIVINVRSFGASPQKVAQHGISMIRGLQEVGIIASAKHFPGLGDIAVDPHLALPSNSQGEDRLREVELYPFAEAIKAGVLSIQTEHLMVPAFESDLKTPASLSSKMVTDLLKKELGFCGLVLSGALRMKALTKHFSDEEIILKAFLAGSDMLLMPQDFLKAYFILKTALSEGKITLTDLDARVLKILQIKEKVGLNKGRIVAFPTQEQLHSGSAQQLKRDLFRSVVSLLRNSQNILPLTLNSKPVVAYVQLGEVQSEKYLERLNQSFEVDVYKFPLISISEENQEDLFQNLDKYPLIFLSAFPADVRRIVEIRLLNEKRQQEELQHFQVHGMTEALVKLSERLQPFHSKIVVAYFGNPFGIHFFDRYSTFIMAYEDDAEAQDAAADILFTHLKKLRLLSD